MLIDSHCHLETFVKSGELEQILADAELAGVCQFVCAGTELEDWNIYRDLAKTHPEKIVYSVGLHPGNIKEDWEEQLEKLPGFFEQECPPVAVGEIGLDEHWMPKDEEIATKKRQQQEEVFLQQLVLAKRLNLPVIVHAREAFNQCVELIDKSGIDWRKVVFHCFSENADAVKILNARGGKASFTGTITYKNAQITRDAALAQGLENLMLETDCPYLAPAKLRGKRNCPAYLRHTAEFVAELFNSPIEKIEEISTKNTRNFFNF